MLPSDGDWMVGLTELQFPSVWPNVINGSVTVRWSSDGQPLEFKLPDGFYDSVSTLLKTINKIFQNARLGEKVVMYHNDIRNRTLLKVIEANGFGVSFSSNIANILGLRNTRSEYYTQGLYDELPADINDGLTALYVYSDIVDKRLVGDSLVPLLRVIPIQPYRSKIHTRWIQLKNVEYVTAVNNHHDTIEINIRRDDGTVIPFDVGKVVVTLHFKRM